QGWVSTGAGPALFVCAGPGRRPVRIPLAARTSRVQEHPYPRKPPARPTRTATGGPGVGPAPSRREGTTMTDRGPASILYVDDDAVNRQIFTWILQRAGFRTREATTGGGALSALAAEKPDLIILDVSLPDIDGFEVC